MFVPPLWANEKSVTGAATRIRRFVRKRSDASKDKRASASVSKQKVVFSFLPSAV